MFVSVGSFTLKKKRKLFRFLRMSRLIEKQALESKGNLGVELSGGGVSIFYVISIWDSMESLKAFAYSGKHHEAIKEAKELSSEIQLLYYETNTRPEMKEVPGLLATHENTRTLKME